MATQMLNALDEYHPSAAYHCGRLLSVFQHVQDLTDGRVGSTYVSRFYTAASTTPCSILPRVWNTARHRLRAIPSMRLRTDIEGFWSAVTELSTASFLFACP